MEKIKTTSICLRVITAHHNELMLRYVTVFYVRFLWEM